MELIVGELTILIDDEDYAIVEGRELSFNNMDYVNLRYEGELTSLHRLLMKPPKHLVVDHRNRNKLDYRKSNLRVCTQLKNRQNTNGHKANKLGRGISFHKASNQYLVRLGKNHQVYYGGRFDTLEEATAARDALALKLYGEPAYV